MKNEEKDRAQLDFDPSYFEDDIKAFDRNIALNEELYEELHTVFNRTTAGSMAFGATRDIAELGRTLSSVRSTGIEAVNKRFQAKKSIVDLKQKAAQLRKDVDGGTESAVVKALLQQLRGEGENSIKPSKPTFGGGLTQAENRDPVNISDREALDRRVKEEIESGNITMTKNDKAMKYDYVGVDYAYNETTSSLCAIDRSTKTVITDYPIERLPRLKIVKIIDNVAMAENGTKLQVIKV